VHGCFYSTGSEIPVQPDSAVASIFPAMRARFSPHGRRIGYDLVTLFALASDEVVLPSHMIRIVEDFLRCLERDSMNPLIPSGFSHSLAFAEVHMNLVST
jgi:hypothetical protein